MIVDGKRYEGFEARKWKGKQKYTLLYIRRQQPGRGRWLVPLEHNGDLVASLGDDFDKDTRAVSWREMPPEVQVKVKEIVEHIKEHGDPIDRDESVFG